MHTVEQGRTISSQTFFLLLGLLVIATYPYAVTLGKGFLALLGIAGLLVSLRWYTCVIRGHTKVRIPTLQQALPIDGIIKSLSAILLLCTAFILYQRYGGFHPLTVNGVVIVIAWLKFCDGSPYRDAIGVFLISTVVFSESLISGYDSIFYLFLFLLFVSMSLVSLNNHNTSIMQWPTCFLLFRLIALSLPLVLICYLLFPRLPTVLFSWQLDGVNSWFSTQEASFDQSGNLPTNNSGHRAANAMADTFNLDQLASLSTVDNRLFTVTFDSALPDKEHLYWRAAVFWHYNGEDWEQRKHWQRESRIDAYGIDSFPTTRYQMHIPAHGKRWLYALDFPVVQPQGTILTRDQQLIAADNLSTDVSYEIESVLVGATTRPSGISRSERRAALYYHPDINPKLHAYGSQMKGLPAQQILEEILLHFRATGFTYDIYQFPAAGKHSLDDFMFTSRTGQCGHYASATVLFLRAAGIPARLVTGFRGGRTLDGTANTLEVTSMMAHAWVEYWTGEHWSRIDPTVAVSGQSSAIVPATGELYNAPRVKTVSNVPSETSRIVFLIKWLEESVDWIFRHYNEKLQAELLNFLGVTRLTLWVGLAGFVTFCLFYLGFTHFQRRIVRPNAHTLFLQLQATLAKEGFVTTPYEGPERYRQRASRHFSVNRDEILELCDVLIAIHYGTMKAQDDMLADIRERINRLSF